MHSVYNTPVIDIASLEEQSQLLKTERQLQTQTETDRLKETERPESGP